VRGSPATNAGPLAGYRILEFATTLSAPFAAMLLADQGADVIKLETEAGDQMRHAGSVRAGVKNMASMFMTTNRNKRSIVLNLKDPEEREIAAQIAARCDVVIQNFRPGVAEKLGLGFEAVRAARPDIIYVSVDGFGVQGPFSKRRVYDPVVQGIAGFAGSQTDARTGEPQVIRNAIIDKTTALTVWQATTAALLHRERTGDGQHVRVSMLKAALSFLWPDAMGNETLIGPDTRPGATMSLLQYVYATKDGHVIVTQVSDADWQAVCRAIGAPELCTDPKFVSMRARAENIPEMNALLAAAFADRTTDEWLQALGREDAVFAPVNTISDLAGDPLIVESGALFEAMHPTAGRHRLPAHPIDFGISLPEYRPAPSLGEHTREVIEELRIGSADR
jgi:crotonobetainyl-CoA:carnitine CoA-transferase CaiB-like acyl-CoA transferase